MFKLFIRVIFNHNSKLNQRGEGLVEIEARQGSKRSYFSTHIYLKPDQFRNGLVINHPNANQLNVVLTRIKSDIEAIELDYILKGKYITVSQLKDAYKEKCTPSALFIDFGKKIIENSDRKDATKNGYNVFFNNFSLFNSDVRISDIDYNLIVKYNNWLKESGVMHNTIVGRLQQLKAIVSEAHKRGVIKENPFIRFKIPSMVNKQGFISEGTLNELEKLNLKRKEKVARDAFLFSCYTGLRFSDLSTLKQDEITNNWIKKIMKKTGKEVEVPLVGLFEDKPLKIIEEYGGNIEKLTRKMGQCGSLNQTLKKVFEMVGLCDTNFTFHTARHTCASLLLLKGIPMTTVQKILGHTKINTTAIYAEVTKEVITNDIKSINKKKK